MKPAKIKNYRGLYKEFIILKIKLYTLVYFTWRLLTGRVKARYYFRVLKRLLFFLSSMKHNKYTRVGKLVKINLYVPGFPSRAFFTACKKMLEFEHKLPCITALISVTSTCRYKCPHCYQRYDKGKDMNIEILVDAVKKMQDKGIAFFNVEGGEPFLVFDRLKRVCDTIDSRSEILINSTGDGMTYENLLELKANKNLLGIMFSLHTYDPNTLNSFMGVDKAWENLEKGVDLCHRVGIPVTFNSCVLKNDFYNGTFERIMDASRNFGGTILQLIKPKPAGGWLEPGIDNFSKNDYDFIMEKVDKYNLDKVYHNYTFISAMIREESESLFGCTAGATDRFYINAKGDLQPCEFLNISFGNIQTDDFDKIYSRMRSVFERPASCLLCEKYAKKVLQIKEKNELKFLPLPPELSIEIYDNWERGEVPDFYNKLEKI